jgi:hypothetical protein
MEVNMQNTAIINEILFEDGYLSSDDVLKDWSVMIALSRIDQFRAEKESFENKYKNSFESHEKDCHAVKGSPNTATSSLLIKFPDLSILGKFSGFAPSLY